MGDFPTERLETWLRAKVDDAGPISVKRFAGGQSNPTYELITPRRRYVLRRKPMGTLLPGAHAIEREYRVIDALGRTGFPVPRLHGICADATVIGAPFYVMDKVEGRIFWDTSFPDLPREERAACFDAMNATIAALHRVDPATIGLGDFGRPGDYFARQISRWTRQYRADDAAGRLPAMERLIDWLPRSIPESLEGEPARIIHGDFRCDNLVFHPTEPRVIAVLDWELSTLGHPLADFTYHLMVYRMPPAAYTGLSGLDLRALAIPSEQDYVADYCSRSGRTDLPALDFCIAFNMFRLAAIIHGIKGRMIRGNASSSEAQMAVSGLESLAELAWAQAKRAERASAETGRL